LRPAFDDPEHHNDFAIWARRALQDQVLAERLGAIDPLQYDGIESLRSIVLDVVEERLSEIDYISWAPHEHEFIFQRGQIVVFDTGLRAENVSELAHLIPNMTTSSIFYHFVEARRREPLQVDDFTAWLQQTQAGTGPVCEQLASVDYYFASLTEMRLRICDLLGAWVMHKESAGS
jgi:hypothetical protein